MRISDWSSDVCSSDLTNPGERVNRPDFGCGLRQLVFAPNSDALAAATQTLVHGALLRWLNEVIAVDAVRGGGGGGGWGVRVGIVAPPPADRQEGDSGHPARG